MRKFLEKYVIVNYIIGSFVKTLFISLVVFTAVFATLHFTGVYAILESALDLKYNSPFVIVPLWGFAGLAVLCFFIGFLMYFYKYKRSKQKSRFYEVFSKLLSEEKTNTK